MTCRKRGHLGLDPFCGVRMAVLSEQLKIDLPEPMHIWYANDISTTASGRAARPFMQRLVELGLSRRVFLEWEKYQYVLPERVPEAAVKLTTEGTTLKDKAGSRYLRGYIGPPYRQGTGVNPKWMTETTGWRPWEISRGGFPRRLTLDLLNTYKTSGSTSSR